MNWYIPIKIAQIWKVDTGEEILADLLSNLYELEYKYNMVRSRPFPGNPQRHENILRHLQEELDYTIDQVKPAIGQTLETWLKGHAIQDPGEWAEQSIMPPDGYSDWEEFEEASGEPANLLDNMCYNYAKYNGMRFSPNVSYDNIFVKMIRDNWEIIQNEPIIQRIQEEIAGPIERERMEFDLQDGLEEFNNIYQKDFQTEQDAEQWVENILFSELDGSFFELLERFSLHEFESTLKENGLFFDFAKMLYRLLIFPLWIQYWSSPDNLSSSGQTITETRETIEKIYQMFQSAKTTDENIEAINLAINATHQTGSMSGHMYEYSGWNEDEQGDLYEFFNSLTEGSEVPEWDEQLRSIGVQV